MNKHEAESEIAEINAMSLSTIQVIYNVDTREEAIQGVLESMEIEETFDYTHAELEAERDDLCRLQGISRY